MDLPIKNNPHTANKQTSILTPRTVALFIFKFGICLKKPVVPGLHVASDSNFVVPMRLFFFFLYCGVSLTVGTVSCECQR